MVNEKRIQEKTMLTNFLLSIGIALLLFILYRGIKGNPEAFSRENMSKSLSTLGVLALLLIGLVSFAVLMLR